MDKALSRRLMTWGVGCLVLGLGLVLTSFLLPRLDAGQRVWTNEKALELQQSAAHIHQLASPTQTPSAEARQSLLEAQQRHDELNQERRDAIDAAQWRTLLVRWGGVALSLLGLALTFAGRENA
jgi:hypothetical protein